MIGAASSVLGAVGGFMGNVNADPGNWSYGAAGFGDCWPSGGAGTFGNYGAVSDYVSDIAIGIVTRDYNVGFTPSWLMVHHSSETKWKFQKFNTDRKLHQAQLCSGRTDRLYEDDAGESRQGDA